MRKKPSAVTEATDMSTADATVATMLAHGMDTVYALPGVHNDHLFDAFQRAGERMTVVHTRHEQGAAYMALGATLATGKPHAYAVVPGPGLLNSGSALLTAYAMNAPVLALIGQIPEAAIGRGFGYLHEIRDQAGIIRRVVDTYAHLGGPTEAPGKVSRAVRAMAAGRPGPAAVECAIDVWGARGRVGHIPAAPGREREPQLDRDALQKAARLLGRAKRVLIVAGGGAQDASPEVTLLSDLLQAPVMAHRRGKGVLDGRSPFSVTLPLGRELWGEADAVLAIGTRLEAMRVWGMDNKLPVIRVDADAEEPARARNPAVALIGNAAPVLRQLIEQLSRFNTVRASRLDEMRERQAKMRAKMEAKIGPQLAFLEAIRAALPEDGIWVDEVTQIGFAARLAFPVYRPRTFLSPGYQDNLGWGYATALGAQHARPDVPVLSINGDGGFMYTANELATAVRHRIPLTAVVFADGCFGNVRRIQQERFGNRLIACDLSNPDFVKFADSFGVAARRATTPDELRKALEAAFASREPNLIEVPVGAFPSPWEFIHMPPVRGR